MNHNPLYRPAALEAKRTRWLGDILLVRPVSFSFLAAFAFFIACVIVAFLVWGSYTKRTTVSGYLIPDTGMVKVYVPQPGIVLEKHVTEGQSVKQGDVLYVLSSERQSSTLGDIQAAISSQVETRQASLRDELYKTRLLQKEEQNALLVKMVGLNAEISKLEGQVEGQERRVELAENSVSRYQGLLTQDYISKEQLQQKQEALLDEQARLRTLERDRISINRGRDALQNELSTLPIKHQNLQAQIERVLTSTGQELVESESKRRLIISAPEAGTATAVMAEVGQALDTSRPLVSIVPKGAQLQAHLYAPSRAVGFIKAGDTVRLRYQAYPYQKFGHHQSTVLYVSKTALPNNELPAMGSSRGGGAGSEPLYLITVTPAQQSIKAYGTPQPLQAGMLLEADVLQDTRRLYEWVLEPLYSLSGKL